jgi:uncharacterized protein (DUF2141 family)
MKSSIFALVVFSALSSLSSKAATLTMEVSRIREPTGTIRVSLYDSANQKAFPTDPNKTYAKYVLPIEGSRAYLEIDNLPAGTYAIALFHDENENSVLDQGFMGIPKEDYGFSNNAHGGLFGPPKFSKAAFDVVEGQDNSIRVEMIKH